MSNFAQIDENNIVVRVIRSETPDDEVPPIALPAGHRWIRTSYHGNIRKNYAGIGMKYDDELDAFISSQPQPYPSWVMNENYLWVPPKPRPEGYFWEWSEEQQEWIENPPIAE
jgi:hypothetical protein